MKLDAATIDISIEELERVVDGARHQTLSNDEHRKLRAAVETLGEMARMLADKDATLRQLRQMLLKPATTEKTRAVLERAGIPTHGGKAAQPPAGKRPRKGHGRKSARATGTGRSMPDAGRRTAASSRRARKPARRWRAARNGVVAADAGACRMRDGGAWRRCRGAAHGGVPANVLADAWTTREGGRGQPPRCGGKGGNVRLGFSGA